MSTDFLRMVALLFYRWTLTRCCGLVVGGSPQASVR